MKTLHVLVNSPGAGVGAILESHLDPDRFRVIATNPGPAFVRVVRCECPEVAVLDRVHERPETAEMEIEILKAIRPEVRIIVLSGEPSARDARLVELGIFYYMTTPAGAELAKIIEAAAKGISGCGKPPPREREGEGFPNFE